MTTPNLSLDERVTVLETRLDTVLPTLATKADIVRLEGKMDAMNERLEGKVDAMNERLEGRIDRLGSQDGQYGQPLAHQVRQHCLCHCRHCRCRRKVPLAGRPQPPAAGRPRV